MHTGNHTTLWARIEKRSDAPALPRTCMHACMQPYHFGAASGMGLCYLKLAEPDAALEAFEEALRINPAMNSITKFVKELREKAAQAQEAAGGEDAAAA